jgi:hypothetical protein
MLPRLSRVVATFVEPLVTADIIITSDATVCDAVINFRFNVGFNVWGAFRAWYELIISCTAGWEMGFLQVQFDSGRKSESVSTAPAALLLRPFPFPPL